MNNDIDEMVVEVEEQEDFVFPDVTEGKREMGTDWSALFNDYWFLWLVLILTGIHVYRRYIVPAIDNYFIYLADKKMEEKLRKNPDLLKAREEAMQEARRRMQEKHDAEALRMAELRKQRDEKKKQEMLNKRGNTSMNAGHVLNDSLHPRNRDKPANPNRSEYNPLMGSSSGSGGYRPSRRSCPGGGCG